MKDKRLQILKNGKWEYVFCRLMPNHTVISGCEKKKALKPRDLKFFQDHFANDVFRVSGDLSD